ncbi:MAG: TraB/GumN family protein [Candidatus Aenigmatarchaeota archaeon]
MFENALPFVWDIKDSRVVATKNNVKTDYRDCISDLVSDCNVLAVRFDSIKNKKLKLNIEVGATFPSRSAHSYFNHSELKQIKKNMGFFSHLWLFKRLKPWAALAYYSHKLDKRLKLKKIKMDKHFLEESYKQGKEIKELISGKEFVDVLLSLDDYAIADSIKETLFEPIKNIRKRDEEACQLYESGDLGAIERMVKSSGKRKLFDVASEKLNQLTYERIRPIIDKEKALFVIDVQSCPYFIEQFEDDGYSISMIEKAEPAYATGPEKTKIA